MNTETNPTITEADVVAFLTARAHEIRAKFGTEFYSSVDARVTIYASGANPDVHFSVGSGKLNKNYGGGTFSAAIAASECESPAQIAAEKRITAAKLLKEADALAPKPEAKAGAA